MSEGHNDFACVVGSLQRALADIICRTRPAGRVVVPQARRVGFVSAMGAPGRCGRGGAVR